MTALGWIVSSVLVLGYLTFALWALILGLEMFSRVQSRLPVGRQLPWIGNARYGQLIRKYRELFPGENLDRKVRVLSLLAAMYLLGAVAAMTCFHLFTRN